VHRLGVLAVDEEVDAAGPPVGGVDVGLGDVDREPRRLELVAEGGVAERVNAHPHRGAPAVNASAEDFEDADLAAALGLVLEPDHPHRRHRARAEVHPRAHLEPPVVRRPAPVRGLELAHHLAVAKRLLADRAADLAREDARLDPRDPQRVVLGEAPEPVLGWDRQPQLGGRDGVRRRALRS
jgi:hypothetical protein